MCTNVVDTVQVTSRVIEHPEGATLAVNHDILQNYVARFFNKNKRNIKDYVICKLTDSNKVLKCVLFNCIIIIVNFFQIYHFIDTTYFFKNVTVNF